MKTNGCDRRQFIKRSSAVAMAAATFEAAALTSRQATAADDEGPAIIDTHQHLWDLDRFNPPWLATADAVLRARYTLDEYRVATAGLNVQHAVYMEIDVAPEQQVEEAEAIIRLCKSPNSPTVAAIISGRPGQEAFIPYINRFRDAGSIKGVRQVLHGPTPRGTCLGEQFLKSVQHLGEIGMSFDICIRPTELGDAAELARRCPHTRFIVDHCGNADPKAFMKTPPADETPQHAVDQWRRDMAKLAELPNTTCKISGIIAAAPKSGWRVEQLAPIVNACWELFGSERIVFGSDWPVCRMRAEYRDWVTALRQIIADRPTAEQLRLWNGNAPRVYRLG